MGPFLDPHVDCIYCRGQRFAFHRVVRLGVYEGLLQELCRASKRPAQFDVATALVEALWSHEHAALRAAEADLVIPVAHHWTETFARPERLSESVGRQLAGRLRVNFSPFILTKTRRTPRQSTLPVTHRLTNLKGAFRVPRRFEVDLRGRRVLLADDVLTTGATADEVSRVLRSAGAAEVVVAVLARGLGRTTSVDPPRGEQPRDASAR